MSNSYTRYPIHSGIFVIRTNSVEILDATTRQIAKTATALYMACVYCVGLSVHGSVHRV